MMRLDDYLSEPSVNIAQSFRSGLQNILPSVKESLRKSLPTRQAQRLSDYASRPETRSDVAFNAAFAVPEISTVAMPIMAPLLGVKVGAELRRIKEGQSVMGGNAEIERLANEIPNIPQNMREFAYNNPITSLGIVAGALKNPVKASLYGGKNAKDFEKMQAEGKTFGNIVHSMQDIPTEHKIKSIRPVLPADATPEYFASLDKQVNTPESQNFWKETYAKAVPKSDPNKIFELKTGQKLENVAIVKLTDNCQRLKWLEKAKRQGLVSNDFPDLDCYGSRWTNRKASSTQNARVKGFVPIEKRDLTLATPEGIDKVFKSEAKLDQMSKAVEVRHGQTGDDSHAIATGLAEYWMKKYQESGLKKPNVFVSASYAPVSYEQYKSLAKYPNAVYHFSNSGWFDKGEILNRFKEFIKAREAGLNAKLRIVTNADGVKPGMNMAERAAQGGLDMPNEKYLMGLVDKYIPISQRKQMILETPYHNDFVNKNSRGEVQRSNPSIKGASVCCVTGKCKTCPTMCMAKSINNIVPKRVVGKIMK